MLSTARASSLFLLLAGWGVCATTGCTQTDFGAGVHEWGAYSVCLTRASDTCHSSELGCSSQAARTESLPIGVSLTGNTFYIARSPLGPVSGEQAATRFEVTQNTASEGVTESLCGCAMDVTETIRGELVSDGGVLPTCPTADGGDAGCGSSPGVSPYDDPDWLLGADGGIDLTAEYPQIRGRIVDVATPRDGGCTCGSCQIVYDFVGSK